MKALLVAKGDAINLSLEHTARKNHEITDALELKSSLTLCESQKKMYIWCMTYMGTCCIRAGVPQPSSQVLHQRY